MPQIFNITSTQYYLLLIQREACQPKPAQDFSKVLLMFRYWCRIHYQIIQKLKSYSPSKRPTTCPLHNSNPDILCWFPWEVCWTRIIQTGYKMLLFCGSEVWGVFRNRQSFNPVPKTLSPPKMQKSLLNLGQGIRVKTNLFINFAVIYHHPIPASWIR